MSLTLRPRSCASMPASAFSSVDLPAAGGPSSNVVRPGGMTPLTLSNIAILRLSGRKMPVLRNMYCELGVTRVTGHRKHIGLGCGDGYVEGWS